MHCFLGVGGLICAVWLGTAGCSPKPPQAPPLVEQSFPHLPEATNILAALNQKDYPAAVASLASLKGSIASQEQQLEYRSLAGQVRDQVVVAADGDPKAAEALQALNILFSGR